MSPRDPPGHRPRRASRDQIKADVLLGLMGGLPLTVIARRNGTSQRTVSDWERRDPEFAERLAQARALGWDSLAAECLEIADDSRNDYMERFKDDGSSLGWQFNTEHVLRSKLRIETRLKLLAKWDTGRYGDAKTVKIEGDVQVTQRHVIDPATLDDAGRAALRALLAHAEAQGLLPEPEPIEAEFEDVSDTE